MKNETDFVRDWVESHGVVSKVCAWLRRLGVEAFLRPPSLRPTEAERWAFSDEGDIAVVEDCAIKRVEVKTRSVAFDGPTTWPYDSVFVDETYHVDRLETIPLLAYVIVGNDRNHCCVIPAAGKSAWRVVQKYDSSQDRTCRFYAAPVEECEWRQLDEADHGG